MSDSGMEIIERMSEVLVSQARLSFDASRVAVRRDDLRALVRLAKASLQSEPQEPTEEMVQIAAKAIGSLRYPLNEYAIARTALEAAMRSASSLSSGAIHD